MVLSYTVLRRQTPTGTRLGKRGGLMDLNCEDSPITWQHLLLCHIPGMNSEKVSPAGLLSAALFAARKHRCQLRKDKQTPYINHPLGVAELLARAGGISDSSTLTAALLHDTLEDTDATPEEIELLCGKEVLEIVREVTDDKELPKEKRRRLQVERAGALTHSARLIRLADKISNIIDVRSDQPPGWSLEEKLGYLQWAESVIAMIRGTHPALEKLFDDVAAEKRRLLQH